MVFYIVGYMAAGKTTFGKALAEKLHLPFIDLDHFIEEKEGKTITEIFKEKGEKEFRALESEMLRNATEHHPSSVISCGGGTPCHSDNMPFMNDNGITIFLETSTPVLISRLQDARMSRPLVAGKTDEEIEEHVLSQLCLRLPDYMEAKLKWHGDDLETAAQIDSNVESFISSYPSIFR